MNTSPTRIVSLAGALAVAAGAAAQDTLTVARDNTVVDHSCHIVIPQGMVIEDTDGNGVIHITADDVTVEFAEGSVLRGAEEGTPWDELTGYGIRIEGAENVTLKGLKVHGFKGGVWATETDGLTVEDADLSDNYRRHLRSTPVAEDSSDWISPHFNDDNEWLTRYGAALYIEDSEDVTVRRVYVRRGQNGILLDRVSDSKIYDNDCSFLSGWGLGMWRSSGNTVSRNAFDFCVRGHVEGVYNRGQDSAGILMFERCSDNVIVENSCTHGGDAIFGFGGRDALGEGDYAEGDKTRLGCNDNLFIGNDLSYAPAHGWEMTFSFGNVLARNRIVENAICGVWGGFSQETLIAENLFDGNGGMPYGLERGAINIEHGRSNRILNNDFINNRVGVHLWYDNPGGIVDLPWGEANYGNLGGNVIADNTFVINDEPRPFHRWGESERRLIVHLRDDSGKGLIGETYFGDNTLKVQGDPEALIVTQEGVPLTRTAPEDATGYHIPSYKSFGHNEPVGARDHLRGRHNIIMTEWGPWDHEEPMLRVRRKASGAHEYELFGGDGEIDARVVRGSVGVQVQRDQQPSRGAPQWLIRIMGGDAGVHPYEVQVRAGDFRETLSGTFVGAEWDVRFWSWDTNPLEDLEAWRAEAEGEDVLQATVSALNFPYGGRGPKDLGISEKITSEGPGGDGFAMIATTTIPLTAGKWRISTISDDGVRVFVDGDQVIERWDIHGPTPDEAIITIERDREVELKVEHFERDGYAMMVFDIEAAD